MMPSRGSFLPPSLFGRGNIDGVLTREKPMLIKKACDIKTSEITDKKLYLERRRFLQMASAAVLTAAAGSLGTGLPGLSFAQGREKLAGGSKSPLSTDEPP